MSATTRIMTSLPLSHGCVSRATLWPTGSVGKGSRSVPNKEDELGALWLKTSAKGDYLTGKINGVDVVVFQNSYKTESKHPDWRVFKSQPREPRA